jgi:hypothetical protein
MHKLLQSILILLLFNVAHSEWQNRYYSDGANAIAILNKQIFVARMNGLSQYNLNNDSVKHYTMINSGLPVNRVNDLLPLNNNQILIATRQGLLIWENGQISSNYDICLKYPDTDARKLHLDSAGRIWTHSDHKLYYWAENNWTSINLADSLSYDFEIWDLMIRSKTVWAIYTNLEKPKVENFYNRPAVITLNNIKYAIVTSNGIQKIIDNEPFMKRISALYPTDAIDYVLVGTLDSLYIYNDFFWETTTKFDINDYKVLTFGNSIINDNKGKLWYMVHNSSGKIFIASFEIATSDKKVYFTNDTSGFMSIDVTKEGFVIAETPNNYYLKNCNDTSWTKISKSSLGLDSSYNYFYKPFAINDTVFINAIYELYQPWKSSILNLKTGKQYFPAQNKMKYEELDFVEIDKNSKGVFRGTRKASLSVLTEPLVYEADSSWVEILPKLGTNNPTIKLAEDGHIYFNQFLKWESNEFKKSYLATFNGNDIILKDLGFTKIPGSVVTDFDCINNNIYALGYYTDKYADTLIPNITIYNLINDKAVNFDVNNSELKKYYYTYENLWSKIPDEVPLSIIGDKNDNIWILTTKNLQKFKDGKIDRFEVQLKDNYQFFIKMEYDKNTNEILFIPQNQFQSLSYIYYFSINQTKYDSVSINNCGIKGNLIKFKKLIDNNVWASDSKGYLYRYQGNGIFKSQNLEANGFENLRFPINDFCIDPKNNLHLATEIGLLSNPDFLNGIQESKSEKKIKQVFYPNPARSTIQVKMEQEGQTAITAVDFLGRSYPLWSGYSGNGTLEINVSNLPAGSFTLLIDYGTKREAIRMIKE